MKRSYCMIPAIVVLLVASLPGLAWSTASWDGAIHRMESKLQTQLARIQRAKEIGSSASVLTRIRVAEQLQRAEQELERHRADLERMKENLEDQSADLGGLCSAQSGQKQRGPLSAAISRLEAQIKAADALLARVEAFRSSVDEPVVPRRTAGSATSRLLPEDWSAKSSAGTAESPEQPQALPPPFPPPRPFH